MSYEDLTKKIVDLGVDNESYKQASVYIACILKNLNIFYGCMEKADSMAFNIGNISEELSCINLSEDKEGIIKMQADELSAFVEDIKPKISDLLKQVKWNIESWRYLEMNDKILSSISEKNGNKSFNPLNGIIDVDYDGVADVDCPEIKDGRLSDEKKEAKTIWDKLMETIGRKK